VGEPEVSRADESGSPKDMSIPHGTTLLSYSVCNILSSLDILWLY
jgi:hypothetical protein